MPGSKKKPPTAPFSLRLTKDEREKLEEMSAGMSAGSYIRLALFGLSAKPRKARGKFPVKDHQALSKLLSTLGESRLANNLNQLAKAANTGSLPLSPETLEALEHAAQQIKWMRGQLIKALGLSREDEQ